MDHHSPGIPTREIHTLNTQRRNTVTDKEEKPFKIIEIHLYSLTNVQLKKEKSVQQRYTSSWLGLVHININNNTRDQRPEPAVQCTLYTVHQQVISPLLLYFFIFLLFPNKIENGETSRIVPSSSSSVFILEHVFWILAE